MWEFGDWGSDRPAFQEARFKAPSIVYHHHLHHRIISSKSITQTILFLASPPISFTHWIHHHIKPPSTYPPSISQSFHHHTCLRLIFFHFPMCMQPACMTTLVHAWPPLDTPHSLHNPHNPHSYHPLSEKTIPTSFKLSPTPEPPLSSYPNVTMPTSHPWNTTQLRSLALANQYYLPTTTSTDSCEKRCKKWVHSSMW